MKLKYIRKQYRLTQAQMALILGTHQPMISRWERGENMPRGIGKIINTMIVAKRRSEP